MMISVIAIATSKSSGGEFVNFECGNELSWFSSTSVCAWFFHGLVDPFVRICTVDEHVDAAETKSGCVHFPAYTLQ